MLIVCPHCATSYEIDQAAVGTAGRTVRCARCKTTWFAGGPKSALEESVSEVTAIADSLTAVTEAHSSIEPSAHMETALAGTPVIASAANGDFNAEASKTLLEIESAASPGEPPTHTGKFALHEAEEPLAIKNAPSLVPPIEPALPPVAVNGDRDSEDIESFAIRRQRLQARRKEKRRSSRWTVIILLLLAFNVTMLGARNEVVRYLPQTASLFAAIGLPVNLRHLKFEDVKISKEVQDGVNMLIINGVIESTAGNPIQVPRLRFAARNATGQEIYTWTALPSRSILRSGERLEFTSRMASPPADVHDVMVRFFNAQDASAGAK
jgi:predicted Zn finger-like uncharacterized protein